MSSEKKLGRNEPCYCGSGAKYKKCHGNPLLETKNHQPPALGLFLRQEQIRRKQQGNGRPFITGQIAGRQIVVAGNTIFHSPSFKTFPDFLHRFLHATFGDEWFNEQGKLPKDQQHVLINWRQEFFEYQKKFTKAEGQVVEFNVNGVVMCVLGLAHSLFLLKHNIEIQHRLLNRLKDMRNFQGAYFECIIANCFIRAGYDIFPENEDDRTSKHCEFYAVSQKTGTRYSVEVKTRAVAGILGKTDADGMRADNPNVTDKIPSHMASALSKPSDGERMIFIDLNGNHSSEKYPLWIDAAVAKLDKIENQTEQRAYVFVTNFHFHNSLNLEGNGEALAYGLNIADFSKPGVRRVSDAYRSELRHADAHGILEALKTYTKLPSTFDGSLPSATFEGAQHIFVGEQYFFEELEGGVLGTVTTATLNKQELRIYFGVTTLNGKSLIATKYITPSEANDYEEYYAEIFDTENGQKEILDGYDLFKFHLRAYKNSTREQLLTRANGWPNFADLSNLPDNELLIEICDQLTALAASHMGIPINATVPPSRTNTYRKI